MLPAWLWLDPGFTGVCRAPAASSVWRRGGRGDGSRARSVAGHCARLHHVPPHRAEDAQELLLLTRGDIKLVERLHQVLNQRVEVGVADAHAAVRLAHAAALVLAGTAGAGANLLHQQALQTRDIGAAEEL